MNFVYPLTKKTDINKVTLFLKKHHSEVYADYWEFALQTPLRISDILEIKFSDLVVEGKDKKIRVKESKTKKAEYVFLNPVSEKIFEKRRKQFPNDIFLFESSWRKYKNNTQQLHMPLTRAAVQKVLSDTGAALGFTLSPHVTRKTRAWFLYEQTNDLALVQHMLNHTHSSVTLRYLGLTEQSKKDTYRDLVL